MNTSCILWNSLYNLETREVEDQKLGGWQFCSTFRFKLAWKWYRFYFSVQHAVTLSCLLLSPCLVCNFSYLIWHERPHWAVNPYLYPCNKLNIVTVALQFSCKCYLLDFGVLTGSLLKNTGFLSVYNVCVSFNVIVQYKCGGNGWCNILL